MEDRDYGTIRIKLDEMIEKQGISKTSGVRKQSGMNCKQFFEKRKNS